MNMKYAATGNDEADFVFIVPVLAIESCQHGFKVRSLWTNVNHVRSHKAAALFQLFYFIAVCGENIFRRCVGFDSVRRLPAFVIDSNACEVGSYGSRSVQGTILIRYSDDGHVNSKQFSNWQLANGTLGSVTFRQPLQQARQWRFSFRPRAANDL